MKVTAKRIIICIEPGPREEPIWLDVDPLGGEGTIWVEELWDEDFTKKIESALPFISKELGFPVSLLPTLSLGEQG